MYCDCEKCDNCNDGFCARDSYVSIDENGQCDFAPTEIRKAVFAQWDRGYCTNCGAPYATDSRCDCLDLEDNRFCYYCGAMMLGKIGM